MNDKEYQTHHFEEIYRDGLLAPFLKSNPKYCANGLNEMIPRISYDDVMDHKYVVRWSPHDPNAFWAENTAIIAEYTSIAEMVDDGWRLD
jgi:hypothetical protein